MKIDKIYISCSKRDFYFAGICIASIRYWYPDIPISLLIDSAWGKIDTTYLEEKWNVKIHNTEISVFKESYIKLEPLFAEKNKRILNIDCDIVLVGKLLDELEKYDEDFIAETIVTDAQDISVTKWWFNYSTLKEWDREYNYPGYVFYAGQYVINTAVLSRADFEPLLTFTEPPEMRHPEIFQQGYDQGILNYIISKKTQRHELTFRSYPYMITQFETEKLKTIQLDSIIQKKGIPQLIHWNGTKKGITSFIPGSDILNFYEKFYATRSSFPFLFICRERFFRTIQHPVNYCIELLKFILKKIINK